MLIAVGYMRSKLTIFKESISPKVFMKGNCPIREKMTIKILRMQNSGGAWFLSKKMRIYEFIVN